MASDLLTAADVARGVCRLFAQQGLVAIPEVTLPNGRRTDLTAIDAKGNMVAATITLNFFFGSGLMVPGTGILLNNQMDDFSAKPGTPRPNDC